MRRSKVAKYRGVRSARLALKLARIEMFLGSGNPQDHVIHTSAFHEAPVRLTTSAPVQSQSVNQERSPFAVGISAEA